MAEPLPDLSMNEIPDNLVAILPGEGTTVGGRLTESQQAAVGCLASMHLDPATEAEFRSLTGQDVTAIARQQTKAPVVEVPEMRSGHLPKATLPKAPFMLKSSIVNTADLLERLDQQIAS